MAYSDAVLSRAKARLNQARQDAKDESNRRIADIYAHYPRLREIDATLRTSVAKVIAASFQKGADPRAAVEAIKKENLSLQQERSWILQSAEIDESDLAETPVCEICGGSGYVGEKMCECLRELCRQEQKKELSSLLGGRESFDGFRMSYYPDRYEPKFGVSARELMTRVFARCRAYAREFSPAAPNLLFSGSTGLGKTYLSACIARAVAESGYSVVYDTAGRLFADFESAKFGPATEENQSRTRKYLACDLLIIDDLGTEMTTQFTQSALYQVVNTRLMDARATIISTNLTTAELSARYLPQIASRLLGSYELFTFLGDDIRILKNREGK